MGKTGSFKYVYIPADVSEPLQELSLNYNEVNEVQCLLNALRVRPSIVICLQKLPTMLSFVQSGRNFLSPGETSMSAIFLAGILLGELEDADVSSPTK